jgi:hypothetical protein
MLRKAPSGVAEPPMRATMGWSPEARDKSRDEA